VRHLPRFKKKWVLIPGSPLPSYRHNKRPVPVHHVNVGKILLAGFPVKYLSFSRVPFKRDLPLKKTPAGISIDKGMLRDIPLPVRIYRM